MNHTATARFVAGTIVVVLGAVGCARSTPALETAHRPVGEETKPSDPDPQAISGESQSITFSQRTVGEDGSLLHDSSFDLLVERRVSFRPDGQVLELVDDAFRVAALVEDGRQWASHDVTVVERGDDARFERGDPLSVQRIGAIWPRIRALVPPRVPPAWHVEGATWSLQDAHHAGGEDAPERLLRDLHYRAGSPGRRGPDMTTVVRVEGTLEDRAAAGLIASRVRGTLWLGPAPNMVAGILRIKPERDGEAVRHVAFEVTPDGSSRPTPTQLIARTAYDATHGADCGPPLEERLPSGELRVLIRRRGDKQEPYIGNRTYPPEDANAAEFFVDMLRPHLIALTDCLPEGPIDVEVEYNLSGERPVMVSPRGSSDEPSPAASAVVTCVDRVASPVIATVRAPAAKKLVLALKQSVAPDGKVKGSLPKESIRATISSHIGEVQTCYEDLLHGWKDAAGRLAVKFIIAPDGHVQIAAVASDSVHHHAFGCCVTRQLRTWRFDKPTGGGIVVVTYPFVLQQTGPGGAERAKKAAD